jgi:hypothetical protein
VKKERIVMWTKKRRQLMAVILIIALVAGIVIPVIVSMVLK